MSRRASFTILAFLIIFSVALLGVGQLRGQPATEFSADVVTALSGEGTSGFARVIGVKEFQFPQDHGAHPEYQTEWWYNTANVTTQDGQRFGIKLTIFRRAIAPTPPERQSEWATNQVYFADFAIADIQNNRFIFKERFARGAADLAGSQISPEVKIWIENWAMTFSSDNISYRLQAADSGMAIDLTWQLAKPIVFQGDRGFSPKSPEEGNASYYYSMTRLNVSGNLTLSGESFAVDGTGWMDREYSTSVLSKDAVGWDWFAIQLDDRREIMLYQIRKRDGTTEITSDGTFVNADGSTVRLVKRNQDYTITPLGTWTSPRTGTTYPHGWKLTINAPEGEMMLEVMPWMQDQELNTTTAYYEGASKVTGSQNGKALSGVAYVELTGYNTETRQGYSR